VVVNYSDKTQEECHRERCCQIIHIRVFIENSPQYESEEHQKQRQRLEPKADKSNVIVPLVNIVCIVDAKQNDCRDLAVRSQKVDRVKVHNTPDSSSVSTKAAASALSRIESSAILLELLFEILIINGSLFFQFFR